MPIPPITGYRLPVETDVPSNVAGWSPDPARAALLIHDMQQYFVDFFPRESSIVGEIVERLRRIRKAAHAAGMPVFYTAQPGAMTRAERGLLQDIWGPGMSSDPQARKIVADLAPAAGDIVLTKWRYSAFHRTGLDDALRRLGRDQLVVGGVYGHVGVLTTLLEAFSKDIETFLVADAFADFTAEDHWMTMRYASQRCAVVLTTDRLLGGIGREVGLGKLSELHA